MTEDPNNQQDPAPMAAGEGHRLHRLGLVVNMVGGLRNLIFPLIAIAFGTSTLDFGYLLLVGIAILFIGFTLFFSWLAWTRFRYIIGVEEIRIESGILNRNARSIPFERIQDVSIEQKLIPRLLGLGEVKFETGGGEGDEGTLAYVSTEEGERLRELVRDRKEGAVATPAPEIANNDDGTADIRRFEPEAEPLFAMDTQRIFTFGLFEFSLVIFAVLFGVAQQFEFILPFNLYDIGAWIGIVEDSGIDIDAISWGARIFGAMAALASLIAIGIATGLLRTFLREYGFRLDRTPKGFRRRRGLTTLTDVVMPAHRVQAAIVQTGFFRRRWGWHALKFVSLAQDSKEEGSHVVAPFAQRPEIDPIMKEAAITPETLDIGFRRLDWRWWFDQWALLLPFALLPIVGLLIFTDVGARAALILLLPVIAALFVWLSWRHCKKALDENQLYFREGWWSPKLTIAPQVKIQSIEISQGPIARLRGLAEMEFGIAGGALSIGGIPVGEANAIRQRLLDEIVKVDFADVNRG